MGIILMEKLFISHSEAETAQLAEKLASVAKKGDVYELCGTLGAGKSVFCRAFVQRLTPAEEVPSPTFTLVQMYPATDFDIYHYDLYRLKNPEEIFELGVEEAFYDGVCLVEWPEKMGEFRPKNSWKIEIKIVNDLREIRIFTDDPEKSQRLENVK